MMKLKSILQPTVGALAAFLVACSHSVPESRDPAAGPEDQLVVLGGDATFTAPLAPVGGSYQWVRQWPQTNQVLAGETRRTLTIREVALADVGFYRCQLLQAGQTTLTPPASLMVETRPIEANRSLSALGGGTTITVYASPVTSSGSSGTCPGSYVGYVSYVKSPGWGWTPTAGATSYVATDPAGSGNRVYYKGLSNDTSCGTNSIGIPNPCPSTKYRFTIYFPTTVPATNAYPITLTGFDP